MDRKIAWILGVALLGCGSSDEQQEVVRARANGVSPAGDAQPVVAFLGTSLTAGQGVAADEAFPALIQHKIDSAGLRYRVVNAGVSGETSAGGLRRIDWLLEEPVAVLVIELGANDGLRGLSLEALRDNLQQIVDRTVGRRPNARILIAAMEAPPNMGRGFTTAFRQVFIDVAQENDAALVPFLLAGVAGVPELNQPDGIHPTAEGQRMMAERVWEVLEPELRTLSSP